MVIEDCKVQQVLFAFRQQKTRQRDPWYRTELDTSDASLAHDTFPSRVAVSISHGRKWITSSTFHRVSKEIR